MILARFKDSLGKGEDAPSDLSPPLQALWYAGKGNWHRAHEAAQDIHTSDGSWIHAHLHRQEGDLSNADYWYARCGKSRSGSSIETEWEEIVQAMLAGESSKLR